MIIDKYFVVVSDHQGDMRVHEVDNADDAAKLVQDAENDDNNRAVVIKCENVCMDSVANPTTFCVEYHT